MHSLFLLDIGINVGCDKNLCLVI